MLCLCAPAGQDEFFMAIGLPMPSRSAPPPTPSKEQQAELGQRMKTLLQTYRTEMVAP